MGCRLGLLAAAQGNGHVSIFSIPDPAEALQQRGKLRKGKGHAGSDSAETRLMNLAPCASAGPDALSGSLVSCIEWLPSHPHDLLLVSFRAAMLTEKQASHCVTEAPERPLSAA